MKRAVVIHTEEVIQYFKDGQPILMSPQDKLRFSIFGIEGVTMESKKFETVIGEFTYFTRAEKEAKFYEVFKPYENTISLSDVICD